MSQFVDDPELTLPAFEPRFGVHRLIKDRGGIYDARFKDGRLSPPPSNSKLDSLHGTLLALDPLLAALVIAGYDPRELVIATSAYGSEAAQSVGYLWASLRSGLGLAMPGNWVEVKGIVDPGTWHSIVAVRATSWRTDTDPAVVPVDLSGVAAYQPHRRPADLDATDHDGWIVLGDADELWSSTIAAKGVPVVLGDIAAAIEQTMGSTPEPGLLRMLNPATWEVPRMRESPVPALVAAAEMIWEGRLQDASAIPGFLGAPEVTEPDAIPIVGLDDEANQLGSLLEVLSPDDWWRFRADLDDELERRRVLMEPLEASLPAVLAKLWTTHWALAVMQLHEFGFIDIVPLPAPTAPAIPVLDLTGYYTSLTDATGDFIAAMQINQAGDELRGFWIDEVLEIWPITGRFDHEARSAGEFRWTLTSTFDGSTGSISLPAMPTTDPTAFGFHVDWAADGVAWSMARRDRRGRVNPTDIVAQLAVTDSAASLEPLMLPIHRSHRDRIVLLGYRLFEQMSVASGVLGDASVAVEAMDNSVVTMAIDKHLGQQNADGTFEMNPLLVRVRVEVAHFLATLPVPEAGGIDAWNQLVALVIEYPSESLGIQALLGISQGHTYEFTFSGGGAQFEAGAVFGGAIGGFAIDSDFEHKGTCGATVDHDRGWVDHYRGGIVLGGPSIGIEGGGDVIVAFYDVGTNELITEDEWTRDDFLCQFVTGELAVGGGFYAQIGAEGGYEPWEGYTFFRKRDGVMASGRGGGPYVEGGFGAKWGLGGSLVGMWGFYGSRQGGTPPGPPPPPPPPPPPSDTIEVRGADSDISYFAVNSSTLTDAAKRMLKDLALDYRPVLDDASSYLIIEGDASRTGGIEDNLDLSRRRVLAIYDYLHSLLTSPAIGPLPPSCALGITDSHIILTPHGESRPEWAGLPDDIENADWRRATIVVSGRYVESFHGAGVLVLPEPGAAP